MLPDSPRHTGPVPDTSTRPAHSYSAASSVTSLPLTHPQPTLAYPRPIALPMSRPGSSSDLHRIYLHNNTSHASLSSVSAAQSSRSASRVSVLQPSSYTTPQRTPAAATDPSTTPSIYNMDPGLADPLTGISSSLAPTPTPLTQHPSTSSSISGSASGSTSTKFSLHPPLAKLKIKGHYNAARKHLNKFMTKTLIPSFLAPLSTATSSSSSSSSSASLSSSSSSSHRNKNTQHSNIDPPTGDDSPAPLARPAAPYLALPAETATAPTDDLRSQRSRSNSAATASSLYNNGSITTANTDFNDTAAAAGSSNTLFLYPYARFTQHDNSSTTSGFGLSLTRVSSWASSTSGIFFSNSTNSSAFPTAPGGASTSATAAGSGGSGAATGSSAASSRIPADYLPNYYLQHQQPPPPQPQPTLFAPASAHTSTISDAESGVAFFNDGEDSVYHSSGVLSSTWDELPPPNGNSATGVLGQPQPHTLAKGKRKQVRKRLDFVKLLPTEVSEGILKYLTPRELCLCALVSRSWREVAESNSVWRYKYHTRSVNWQTVRGYLYDPAEQTSDDEQQQHPTPSKTMTWKRLYSVRFVLDKRWASGKVEAKALFGHMDSVYCAHYNDDIIVTGSRDNTVKVWNAETGTLIKTLSGTPSQQVQAPDNATITAPLTLNWNEQPPQTQQQAGTPRRVIPLFGDTQTNASTSRQTEPPFSAPTSSSSSQSITSLSSASASSTTSSVDDEFVHTGSVVSIHFDGMLMVSGSSDCSFIVWDVATLRGIVRVRHHTGGILGVCVGEKYIATCSKDSTICVWDRTQCRAGSPHLTLLAQLRGHRGPVNAIQLRGEYMVSAGGDGLVKLWSMTGADLPSAAGTDSRPVSVDSTMAPPPATDPEQPAQNQTPQPVCIRSFRGHTRGLACVQLYDDMRTIISGGNDNTIRMWDAASGRCTRVLEGHRDLVRSLDVSTGRIVSASYDLTIKVWDARTGDLVSELAGWFGSWIFTAKATAKKIVATSFGIKPVILDFSDGLEKRYVDMIK